jgi:HEAT repeat protein
MGHLGFAFSAAILLFGTLGCSPRFDSRGKPSDDGKTIAEWVALSTDGPVSDRTTAVGTLANIQRSGNADPRIVPALVKALDDDAPDVRCVAAAAFLVVGTEGSAAGVRLLQLLDDKVAIVRRAAAESIPHVGVPAVDAVPRLTRMLDDDNHLVRVWTANALAKYGPDAKAAIPRMETMSLNEESPAARNLVKEAIRKIRGTDDG